MIDTLVLYWQPGSGGDTVHQILSLDPHFVSIVDEFVLTDQGRSQPRINSWFQSNFAHERHQWLWRQWSRDDLYKLESRWPEASDRTLILPTHRRDQAIWLKDHIPGCRVIGICYPENLYFLVLQNWVRKVGAQDEKVRQIYQHEWPNEESLELRLFKDQLQFGSNICPEVAEEWDINLQLGDLMLGRLDVLYRLGIDPDGVAEIMDAWLPKQKKLYQYQWTTSLHLQAALGTNHLAPRAEDPYLALDFYDKILLQHWCRTHDIPCSFGNWASIQDAEIFFAAQQVLPSKYPASLNNQ